MLNPISAGAALIITAAPIAVGEPAAGTPDFVSYLLQGGPFAAVLVLIILDKLAPTGERNRLREEVKEYKLGIQELNNKLLEVLPPLTEMLPLLRDLTESRTDRQSTSRSRRGD